MYLDNPLVGSPTSINGGIACKRAHGIILDQHLTQRLYHHHPSRAVQEGGAHLHRCGLLLLGQQREQLEQHLHLIGVFLVV
jgi:hypothetical protein